MVILVLCLLVGLITTSSAQLHEESLNHHIPQTHALLNDVKAAAQAVLTKLAHVRDRLTPYGQYTKLKEAIENLNTGAQKMVKIIDQAETLLASNAPIITTTLASMNTTAASLELLAHKVYTDLIPQIENALNGIASATTATSTQVADITHSVNATAQAILANSIEIQKLIQQINQGKGFVGKMIYDEADTYDNFKYVMQELHNTFFNLNRSGLYFDGHLEFLYNIPHKEHCYKDFKQYGNALICLPTDCFVVAGLTFSQWGYTTRKEICRRSGTNSELTYITKRHRNSFRPNLQLGNFIGKTAVRVGIFEGTIGAAADYYLPLGSGGIVASLEIWDFNGSLHFLHDKRPHLKVLARLFINPSIYLALGLDDFVSSYTKAAFIGAGATFAFCDIGALIKGNR